MAKMKSKTAILLGWFIGISVMVFVAIALMGLAPIFGLEPKWLWVVFAAGYILSGFRIWDPVGPDQQGVRVILGRPFDTVGSGPVFAPLGIVEIIRYSTATLQREFPAEPEKIFRPRKEDKEEAPAGMVPPLRITFAANPISEADAKKVFGDFFSVTVNKASPTFVADVEQTDDGLANSRVTAEVPHISRYRIMDAVRFTIAIPPAEDGDRIDEVFRQIEDEQVIALNTILAQITVAQAQRNIAWINAVLFRKVCLRIKADDDGHSEEWGIDLEGAAIKPITFNRGLNDAITGVAEATFAAAAKIRTAEAEKQKLILEGDGTATAARALEQETLVGRAVGLKQMAKDVQAVKAGEQVLAAETARAIGDKGNTIVVGADGISQLIGLAKAALPPKKE